jgi:hypothetical protein
LRPSSEFDRLTLGLGAVAGGHRLRGVLLVHRLLSRLLLDQVLDGDADELAARLAALAEQPAGLLGAQGEAVDDRHAAVDAVLVGALDGFPTGRPRTRLEATRRVTSEVSSSCGGPASAFV